MANDLNALVPLHATAIVPRAVGRLDDKEMRVIDQPLVEHIDLEPLPAKLVDERLRILTGREPRTPNLANLLRLGRREGP
jgi:hypothetical protein